VTLTELAALAHQPLRCTALSGHLACVLPAGHTTGHVWVHESSAPDRKAG
jgi:hypothetical protein